MPGLPEKYLGWAQGLGSLSSAELLSLPSSPASAGEPDSHHPPRGLEVKVNPNDEQMNSVLSSCPQPSQKLKAQTQDAEGRAKGYISGHFTKGLLRP